MLYHILQKVCNILPEELPRTLHGWLLHFFLKTGTIIGWTLLVAVVVARYSLQALLLVTLAQAILTIVGMLLFSLLLTHLSPKNILGLSAGCVAAVVSLALLFFQNTPLFIIFMSIASGLFLPQISILISSYLEDFFTPIEAERTVPLIETSEVVAGIVGGFLLSQVHGAFTENLLLALWIGFLLLFLGFLFFAHPTMPEKLEVLDEKSRVRDTSPQFSWNGLVRGVTEIRNTPFLQFLLGAFFFHWLIGYVLDFLATEAVDNSIQGFAVAEREEALMNSLGVLHMIFHGMVFLVQIALSARLLKNMGTFAGFILHFIVTLLGVASLFVNYSFFSILLMKNNFSMTTVIQKNAYETAYYAFHYGTLRSIREFFEGCVRPVATILGMLVLLSVDMFFVAEHVPFVMTFFLLLCALGMGFFALSLRDKYTALTLDNLWSNFPLAQHHAIEIISQKGHKNSYEQLVKLFRKTKSRDCKMKIIHALSYLGDMRACEFLLRRIPSSKQNMQRAALQALYVLADNLRRDDASRLLRQEVAGQLQVLLHNAERDDKNDVLPLLLLRVLARYKPQHAVKYLDNPSVLLQAEAMACLWNQPDYQDEVRQRFQQFAASLEHDDALRLAYIARNGRIKEFKKVFLQLKKNDDPMLRLFALYGLVNGRYFHACGELVHLLLYGDIVVFKKGLELIRHLPVLHKQKIQRALLLFRASPAFIENDEVLRRTKGIDAACFHDFEATVRDVNYFWRPAFLFS